MPVYHTDSFSKWHADKLVHFDFRFVTQFWILLQSVVKTQIHKHKSKMKSNVYHIIVVVKSKYSNSIWSYFRHIKVNTCEEHKKTNIQNENKH